MLGYTSYQRRFPINNSPSVVEAINKLNNNTLTIEDILSCDEVITSCKSNSDICRYFDNKENILKLISYSQSVPKDKENINYVNRLCFNACDLLSSSIFYITKNILDDKIIMKNYNNVYINSINNCNNNIIQNNSNNNIEEHDSDTNNKLMNIKEKSEDNINKDTEENQFVNDVLKVKEVLLTCDSKLNVANSNNDYNLLYKVNNKNNNLYDEFQHNNKDKEDINNNINNNVLKEENKTEQNANSIDKNESNNLNTDIQFTSLDSSINNNNNNIKDDQTYNNDKSNIETNCLDSLFSFLDSKEELDYVLCGYFSRIISNLLNNKHKSIIMYIYSKTIYDSLSKIYNNSIFNTIINHLNRKSISYCAFKILISYYYDIPNAVKIKIQFINNILNLITNTLNKYSDNLNLSDIDNNFKAVEINKDLEIVWNISDMLIEVFSIRELFIQFCSDNNFVSLLVDFIVKNYYKKVNSFNCFCYFINFLIKINDNFLKEYFFSIEHNVYEPITHTDNEDIFQNILDNVHFLVVGNQTFNASTNNDLFTKDSISVDVLNNNDNLFKLNEQIISNIVKCQSKLVKLVIEDITNNFSGILPLKLTKFKVKNKQEKLDDKITQKSYINSLQSSQVVFSRKYYCGLEYLRTIFEIMVNIYGNFNKIYNIESNEENTGNTQDINNDTNYTAFKSIADLSLIEENFINEDFWNILLVSSIRINNLK